MTYSAAQLSTHMTPLPPFPPRFNRAIFILTLGPAATPIHYRLPIEHKNPFKPVIYKCQPTNSSTPGLFSEFLFVSYPQFPLV